MKLDANATLIRNQRPSNRLVPDAAVKKQDVYESSSHEEPHGLMRGFLHLGHKMAPHGAGVKPPSDEQSVGLVAPLCGLLVTCAAAILLGHKKD